MANPKNEQLVWDFGEQFTFTSDFDLSKNAEFARTNDLLDRHLKQLKQEGKVAGGEQASASIDNLQNYCLGSSRGKSRLLRWFSRWLHSHLHGENGTSGCTRAQSFDPSEVAAVCLVVFGSLFRSLL